MRRLRAYFCACIILQAATPALAQQQVFRGFAEGAGRALLGEVIRQQQQQQQPQQQRPQQQQPQQAPATASQNRIPAAPSVSRQDVATIQARLAAMGYDPGPVDGLMGKRTATAIQQYQLANGLPATGQPSSELAALLRATGPAVAPTTTRTTAVAANPSFDCSLAGTATEHAICGSPRLAELDRALSAAYQNALHHGGSEAQLRAEQRNWMGQRNACGASEICLEQMMQQRISSLGAAAPLPGADAVASAGFGAGGGVASGTADAIAPEAAYLPLLHRYIRSNPQLLESREFLTHFAGLGCRADGWGRGDLNPFERQEAIEAGAARLAGIAAAPASDQPLKLLLTLRMTVGDYDMQASRFPFTNSVSLMGNLQAQDLCRTIAIAEGFNQPGVFPLRYGLAGPEGTPLEGTALPALFGGSMPLDRDSARAFYEKGYPNLTVRLVAIAGTPAEPEHGVSLVPLTPVSAEVFAIGTEDKAPPLAVFGPDDFVLPEAEAQAGEVDGIAPKLTMLDLVEIYLTANPDVLADPAMASAYAYSTAIRGDDTEDRWGENRCEPIARLHEHDYDEFDIQRLLADAPALAAERLAAVRIPERFLWETEARLGTYDTARGGFPVEGGLPRRGDRSEMIQIHPTESFAPLSDCLQQRARLQTPNAQARDNGMLNFVPMAPDAAERLVTAAPDRNVSLSLVIRPAGTESENHATQVNFTLESASITATTTGEVLLQMGGEEITEANAESDMIWAAVTELTTEELLLESVRQKPELARDAEYANRWISYAFCQQLYETRDNPIRRARLVRDHANALADAVASPALPRRSIHLYDANLGDYDIDTEMFSLVGRSLSEDALAELRMGCGDALESSAPVSYLLSIEGLADVVAGGLPLSLEDADAYMVARGNDRNHWGRIHLEIILDDYRFGAVDDNGKQAVIATAVGYRILDAGEEELLYEASFVAPDPVDSDPTPDAAANDTQEAPDDSAATAPAATTATPLSLLGLSLGMPQADAIAALSKRYGSDVVAEPEGSILSVERGTCDYVSVLDPAIAAEIGATCITVMADAVAGVQAISVRNVVEGQHADAYAEQMTARFGQPVLRDEAEAPEGLLLGWGDVLHASAEMLGRENSEGRPLHTLEARLVEAQNVTLVQLRLDADIAQEAEGGALEGAGAPPAIDF